MRMSPAGQYDSLPVSPDLTYPSPWFINRATMAKMVAVEGERHTIALRYTMRGCAHL